MLEIQKYIVAVCCSFSRFYKQSHLCVTRHVFLLTSIIYSPTYPPFEDFVAITIYNISLLH